MKITEEKIKSLNPCEDGLKWFIENSKNESDLLAMLLKLNKVNPNWARWGFSRLATKQQNQKIAIFSAELVLDIFEKKSPNDKRPREAIQAAKDYLVGLIGT